MTALQIMEMQVNMDCSGCQRKIRKALSQIKGVESVEIDMAMQKVRVSGFIDEKKVLKGVRKCGKKAELWPYPYHNEYNSYINNYYEKEIYSSNYNYRKHGYNGSTHGYYQNAPYSTLVNHKLSDMFSDENPHACTIM